jgi:1-acyl-sn-glycerol-3-phosphate acyltransferase
MLSAFGYALGAPVVRLFASAFVDRRVSGTENIPRHGACILAPNHISHFDPPLIGISTGRHVDWMAMQELFTNPLLRVGLHWLGAFPVGRGKMDRAAVRTAIDRLAQGRFVGVFPEGGLRTGPASILEGAPVKRGVATLSHITKAPVVPCLVIGSDALYARRRWLPGRRTPVWIVFGEKLPPPADEGHLARGEFEALLGGTMQRMYAELRRTNDIPPESLPQPVQRRKGREAP